MHVGNVGRKRPCTISVGVVKFCIVEAFGSHQRAIDAGICIHISIMNDLS